MLPIRPATAADTKVLTELGRVMHDTINGPHPRDWTPACEEIVAMNRYAGHPLPVNRYTAARTPSDHGEAPVPS